MRASSPGDAGREEGAERQLAAGVEQQVDAFPGGEQPARVLSRDPLRPAQAAGALAQRAQIRDGGGGGGRRWVQSSDLPA